MFTANVHVHTIPKSNGSFAVFLCELSLSSHCGSFQSRAMYTTLQKNKETASAEWNGVFGEALSSPGTRRRNKKLLSRTPNGEHMTNAAAAWLSRHQNKAQGKLERKVASRLATRQPKAADAGPSSIVPITLRSWPGRMPSQATRGREPQVVVFDMDVLAERYRESLWGTELMTSARPGLLAAAARLRERFLLCVLCRSPVPEAIELVRALYDKGLGFDYAYALPPSSGRAHATPVLDVEAMRLLREEIGMTVASMGRRMLAVISLELEDAEIEARLPRPMQMPAWLGGAARHGTARHDTARAYEATAAAAAAASSSSSLSSRGGRRKSGIEVLVSAASPRPHVRLLLPGVTTLLVPHSRLQPENATIGMALIAELLFQVHRVAPHDWVAAHATRDPAAAIGAGGWASGLHPGLHPASLVVPEAGAPLPDLAGLARLVVPAAELARVGLAPSMQPARAGLQPLSGRMGFGLANSDGDMATGGEECDAEGADSGAAEGVVTGSCGGGKPSTASSSTSLSDSEGDEHAGADADEYDDAIHEDADEVEDEKDARRSTAQALASSALSTAPNARLLVLCVARLRAAGAGIHSLRSVAGSRGSGAAPQTPPRPGLHAPELFEHPGNRVRKSSKEIFEHPGTRARESSKELPAATGATAAPSASSTGHAVGSPVRLSPLGRPISRGAGAGTGTAAFEVLRPPSPSECCDLSVAPFERWATEDAPTPPCIPSAPKIPWVDCGREKRRRKKRNKEKR